MKIGIIDADLIDNGTRHPNLALMKISGFYKNQGHTVKLLTDYEDIYYYDKVFISRVFSFTQVPEWVKTYENVTIGGTGFYPDGGPDLDDEIEHHMPDYELYSEYVQARIDAGKSRQTYGDYLDFSIGFATRGCFRKCEFCVNKKYKKAFRHAPIEEFLDDTKPMIYLWDDNFLAYSGWESVLDELEATNKPFQFRQGLDIRLITKQSAKRLSRMKYHGDFIFAFDHIEDREIIETKLKLWKRYSSKTTKLYIFCAYESQDEEDIKRVFERIRVLMKYGCLPYIMRYESYKESEYRSIYTQLARWCNQPQFFKKKSFREFCLTNQLYHKNKETNCAAYQAMIDFEAKFPDIAKEYFDMKFEEENQYAVQLGFGRKYPYRYDCDFCREGHITWLNGVNGIIDEKVIIANYFAKELDLQCLTHSHGICKEKQPEEIASWFCQLLLSTSIYTIIDLVSKEHDRDIIDMSTIPQYSNFEDATGVNNILMESGIDEFSFDEMGYYLNGKGKKVGAKRKYGENHAKLAALLDIAQITFQGNRARISSSVLGKVYYKLSNEEKELILARLIIRIPIIQNILVDAMKNKVKIDDYFSEVSQTTHMRRKPHTISLLKYLKEHTDEEEMNSIFKNIEEM